MLMLLVSLVPLAASSHLKAVPYGRVSSAETLFPLPTPFTALTIVVGGGGIQQYRTGLTLQQWATQQWWRQCTRCSLETQARDRPHTGECRDTPS
jgi:hypothetical protein